MTRKLYLIVLMALVAMTGFAQKRQTGDVMYVYQKNGQVNSFVRSEIEEMSYSTMGIDSLEYNEPVTQLIATADSLYRYALADIDSISFITPDAVYKPGVIALEGELLQYVERCDSTTITFAANTPAGLLPKVGDKLGIGYLCEQFPDGFAGVVKSVEGTTVKCDYEELEEIFETFYCVMTADAGPAERAARRRALEIVTPYEKDFYFDPYVIDLSKTLGEALKVGSFAFQGESVLNATIKPTLHLKAEIAMRPPFNLRFSTTISGDVHLISHAAAYGSVEFAKDLAYSTRLGNFYGFGIDLKVGAFGKIKGDITTDIENRQRVEFTTGFSFGPKDMTREKPATTFRVTENKTIIHKAGLDGMLGYGAVIELGIAWVKDNIAKGVFHAEFGPQYKSNVVITQSQLESAKTSTALYDMLKDRTIEKYQVVSTSWDFYVLEKYGRSFPAPWGNEEKTNEWDIVPKFYNTSLVQNREAKTTAEGSTVARGDCAFEHKLGMVLQDDKGRYLDNVDWTFLSEQDFKSGRENLNCTFKDLKDDDSETYKLYPMVMVGGVLAILASPSADLEKEPFPVRIVNFEQTGSHYSKQQGYEYEGKRYYYKFNATTTVELDSEAKNVKDWGYIYHDIYNVDKKISCANLGSNPYADQRYAYYYNSRERTVRLTPYIQYAGETEIQKGSELTYFVEYTIPVRIVSFEQTGSEYSEEQGFVYDDVHYSYRFNATTTVELDEDEQNVKDWGYIYHDIYGEDKKISCANLGSNPYPDKRYAYYSNDSERTVELTPYIQYSGEDVETGRKSIYPVKHVEYDHTCPDNNHPHMIDLGLPSGTLWACCNVGASTPEQYGNYYRWGETQPYTEEDTWESYQLWHDDNGNGRSEIGECSYSGDNIAGSGYDAATANWGAPWQMATNEQFKELDKYCKGTYTTQNGVNGLLYVSSNGGSIFLPAAGYAYYTRGSALCDVGVRGCYWTDYAGKGDFTIFFTFAQNVSGGTTMTTHRVDGYSIRPVRKR